MDLAPDPDPGGRPLFFGGPSPATSGGLFVLPGGRPLFRGGPSVTATRTLPEPGGLPLFRMGLNVRRRVLFVEPGGRPLPLLMGGLLVERLMAALEPGTEVPGYLRGRPLLRGSLGVLDDMMGWIRGRPSGFDSLRLVGFNCCLNLFSASSSGDNGVFLGRPLRRFFGRPRLRSCSLGVDAEKNSMTLGTRVSFLWNKFSLFFLTEPLGRPLPRLAGEGPPLGRASPESLGSAVIFCGKYLIKPEQVARWDGTALCGNPDSNSS